MKKIVLALFLAMGSMFAIDLGILKISPEIGATLSYNKSSLTTNQSGSSAKFKNDKAFSPGAYARLWLGIAGFMIAPQVKYDYLGTSFSTSSGEKTSDNKLHNIQYGGVLGYEIPFINLTPFVGASYSTFKGDISGFSLKNTYAINFGMRWSIPFLPLLIVGFEGSWQKTNLDVSTKNGSGKLEMLNLGGTIGFAF